MVCFIGIYASLAGALGIIGGVFAVSSLAVMITGQAVAGVGFGLPIVFEGQLVGPLGEVPAVVSYTALTVLLTLISLAAQTRITRRTRG